MRKLWLLAALAVSLTACGDDGDEAGTTAPAADATTVAVVGTAPARSTQPAEPSTAAAEATVPALPPSALDVTWEQIVPEAMKDVEPTYVRAVAADGDLVVAGGDAQSDPDEESRGAFWVSEDGGRAWERIDVPELVTGTAVGQVVHGPAGFLAMASEDSELDDPPAFLLRSTDGRTWERLETEVKAYAIIAANETGYLAVNLVGEYGDVMAYTSSDGQAWETHQIEDYERQPRLGRAYGGPGGWAVTAELFGDPNGGAVVWTSADGITWGDHVFADAPVEAVASLGNGWVALGPTQDFGAAIATQAEAGGPWQEGKIDAALADVGVGTPTAAGFFGGRSDGDDSQCDDLALWTWNGLEATRDEPPLPCDSGEQSPNAGVATAAGVVLVGEIYLDDLTRGIVWIGTPVPAEPAG